MTYRVEFERSAATSLDSIQRRDRDRIVTQVEALAHEPRPVGAVKLKGNSGAYRIRVGNYRVVYLIEDTVRVVTVTRVAHRREVYR